jgi:hypothetical protein
VLSRLYGNHYISSFVYHMCGPGGSGSGVPGGTVGSVSRALSSGWRRDLSHR